MDGVNKFLRGELILSEPARRWREENGVIYFPINSDGTTGEQWIARLESKGFCVGDYAKSVLRSKSFKPTAGITCEIAVLKGEIFSDNERITKNIRKEAKNRKFSTPNAEVACLIREKFSDKELKAMGLCWIVTMHEPIKDSDGDSVLLSAGRNVDDSWLGTGYDYPGKEWNRSGGFAFVVSQVSGS
ncbi:MAG: hypothetical protein PHG95_04495 [Patescibacteria group bacterium]|nr:hypothetical protein [Patescibacteria group bacterium]